MLADVNRKSVISALILAFLFSMTSLFAGPAEEGQAKFNQVCIACHKIGGGKLVGPDLKDVSKRRERDWILRFIIESDSMIASGDAIAQEMLKEFNNVPMPRSGLSQTEAENVLAYIDAASGGAPTAAAGSAVLSGGDAGNGRGIFVGSVVLENGGLACISCHTVAGVGQFGGGTLGPELTPVAKKYGPDGLTSALKSLPFPTMQGIYKTRPLSDKEQADLYAFFQESGKDEPVKTFQWGFVGLGFVGFVIFAILPFLVWAGRMKGVRIPMVGGKK